PVLGLTVGLPAAGRLPLLVRIGARGRVRRTHNRAPFSVCERTRSRLATYNVAENWQRRESPPSASSTAGRRWTPPGEPPGETLRGAGQHAPMTLRPDHRVAS